MLNCEMCRGALESCPLAGFGISDIEALGATPRELVVISVNVIG